MGIVELIELDAVRTLYHSGVDLQSNLWFNEAVIVRCQRMTGLIV